MMNQEMEAEQENQDTLTDNMTTRHEQEMTNLQNSDAYKNMTRQQQIKAEKDLTKKQKKETQKRKDDEEAALQAIEDAYSAQRTAIAKQEKAAKIISAIIDGYKAVTTTFATFGYPAGIVPAAIVAALSAGQVAAIASTPIPTFAQGGSFVTEGEQMFIAGDNAGGRERIDITPLSATSSGKKGGGDVTINVNVTGSVMTQEFTEEQIAPAIADALRRGNAPELETELINIDLQNHNF